MTAALSNENIYTTNFVYTSDYQRPKIRVKSPVTTFVCKQTCVDSTPDAELVFLEFPRNYSIAIEFPNQSTEQE